MQKRGDSKRAVRLVAQRCAEESAEKAARAVWLAYWKKFDKRRRRIKVSA
jgi:hypothetical protein